MPSFYGITVGMWLSGTGIGSNTQLPGSAGEGGAVANTQVIAVVTAQHHHHQLRARGVWRREIRGPIGAIPAGTTLTFSIPPENTNFLEPATGTDLSATGNPFTYAYEFGQSKADLADSSSARTIYGAAVPGAAETAATSQNILAYFPSGTGYTGYVTGGWTGIDSGYPSAFGYIDPDAAGLRLHRAEHDVRLHRDPVPGQDRRPGRGGLGGAVQRSRRPMPPARPSSCWPIHDYGAAAWNTTTNSPDWIALHHADATRTSSRRPTTPAMSS